MSKYFDETFGTDPTPGVGSKPWTAAAEVPAAEPGAARSVPSRAARPTVPVSRTLRLQFAAADAMGAFQESYRGLRTRLLRQRSEKGLRSVAITSAMQGEGKTLTSLHLAYSCAQLQDMRVLLIDADIRSFGLSRLLHAPTGMGLSDILAEKADPEHAILPTDLPNLHFLHGGSNIGPPAELLASRRLLELMDWCSETYSLVIVDTPPLLNLTDVELITAHSDGIVMIVRSQETLSENLRKSAVQLDSKKLLGIVLNGARAQNDVYKYNYGIAAK